MPDDLVLPGIDDVAPAAPDAKPSDEAATPTASVEKPLETAATDEPPEAKPEAPETPEGEERPVAKGVQKRLNEFRDQVRQAEERAARAEARNEKFMEAMLRGQVPQQQRDTQVAPQPPKKEDFPSWEAYDEARISYIAEQKLNAALGSVRQQSEQNQHDAQQRQMVAAVEQGLTQVRGALAEDGAKTAIKYPDWSEVMDATTVDVPPHLQVAIAMSGAPGDVGYYLAKHEDLIPRLARLPELQLGVKMAQIAHAMRSGSAVSTAPAPGRPAGSRGSNAGGYQESFTPEQHLAWEKRQAK